MIRWQIGDVSITKLVELEMTAPTGGAGSAIPEAHPAAVQGIPWLVPDFADERGFLKMSVHALLVDAPGLRLIVDTCVGNDKPRTAPFFNQLHTDFLARLNTAGWSCESVQAVLCTHLHVDHVGWNTMLEAGQWRPTFPNARYLIGRQEYHHWTSEAPRADTAQLLTDSIEPLLSRGLVDLIETDTRLSAEISLFPTPGHTPGHVSVLIESAGRRAVITGDTMHHPCQIACPDWSSGFDSDPDLSRATRRGFLTRFADQEALIIGTHFGGPSAGRLVREGAAYRLIP